MRQWFSALDDSNPAKRHSHYKCVDKKGIYFPSDISWPGGGGPKYEVIHPIAGKACKIPERGWVYPSINRMNEVISQGLVHFGPDETTVPCSKTYLEDNEYETPYSVFYKDGRAATKRLNRLLAEGVFPNPKDETILASVLDFCSSEDALIIDFFSGSASTAHAVMQMNAIDKSSTRRYIMIQLPENLDKRYDTSSTNDRKKQKRAVDFLDSVRRPHTLDQIGIERIIRAAAKIKEEHPNTTADLGFRHFTLVEPTVETLDKLEAFTPDENGMYINNTILEEFGAPTVLATWLVRDGYGFTASVQTLDFSGYTAYYMGKHLYFINQDLTNAAIEAVVVRYETDGNFNPENVALFGYNFKWSEIEALRINLNRLKDTEKNLRINVDVRY